MRKSVQGPKMTGVAGISLLDPPRQLWDAERGFNHHDKSGPPALGVSLSGGGNRAASFGIGVLAALHERGLLSKVDVISAVSGGSYALSWLLLQPYYYSVHIDSAVGLLDVQSKMFDPEGGFQRYLEDNARLGTHDPVTFAVTAALNAAFNLLIFNPIRILTMPLFGNADVAALRNKGSAARTWYRSAIQATYQVLPDPETGTASKRLQPRETLRDRVRLAAHHLELSVVPRVTFSMMRDFAMKSGLPAFVFQTTIHPPPPDHPGPIRDRVFEIGALGFGSDSCGYTPWGQTEGLGWEPGDQVGDESLLQPAEDTPSPFATLRNMNTAPAISGAAISGIGLGHWAPRFLVDLSNFGLEYAIPDPRNPRRVVYLSDGGHSENLGALSLIRRGCRSILITAAEHDAAFRYPSYRVLRRATQELGLELEVPEIDSAIQSGGGRSNDTPPILTGSVRKDRRIESTVYYVKLAMNSEFQTGQPEAVADYKKTHPRFPQEPTTDQYFQPAQFRAYRALGHAIGRHFSPPP